MLSSLHSRILYNDLKHVLTWLSFITNACIVNLYC